MATRMVVCPECDTPLSPGRLACSACGALVASVASAIRTFPAEAPPALLPVEEAVPEPAARVRATSKPRRAASAPSPETNGNSHVAMNGSSPAAPPVSAPRAAPVPVAHAPVTPAPAAATIADPNRVPDVLTAVPSWPEAPAWPPVRPTGEPVLQRQEAEPRVLAGAYLPPSAVLPPGEALPLRNGNGHPAPAPTEAPAAPSSESAHIGGRFRLGEGDGPLGIPVDAATKTIAIGAGITAFGFILPWAEIVIGSRSVGSYLDEWGLAGPGHVIVLLAVLGIAAASIVAARLPRWLGLALPAVSLAFLLLGLAWPYVFGPFRTAIGVYVVVVGALVLILGGLLDRATRRHAELTASV
jgi:hypothetical protein